MHCRIGYHVSGAKSNTSKKRFSPIKKFTYTLLFCVCYSTSPTLCPTRARKPKTGKYTYAQLCSKSQAQEIWWTIYLYKTLPKSPSALGFTLTERDLECQPMPNKWIHDFLPNAGSSKPNLWEKLNDYICIQVWSKKNRQKSKEGALRQSGT